jgi:hypothetical protein
MAAFMDGKNDNLSLETRFITAQNYIVLKFYTMP